MSQFKHFILVDFAINIDTISMVLSSVYFKELQVEILNFTIFKFLEILLILS